MVARSGRAKLLGNDDSVCRAETKAILFDESSLTSSRMVLAFRVVTLILGYEHITKSVKAGLR